MKDYLFRFYNFCIRQTTFIIFITSLFFTIYINYYSNKCENVIRADGLGYYSYLPAIFIYNDYQFLFIEDIKQKHPQINFGDGFLNPTNNGNVNKYYLGLSILFLPFFLIAHILSTLFNQNPDGYSLIYQLFVLIASNFYLFIGCIYTKKLISIYINKLVIQSIILVTLVFGTNLFFYASYDVTHTHVYSFALIAAFLYYSYKFCTFYNSSYLYILSILLGVITLLRPTNIVIALLIIFFAKNLKNLLNTILNKKLELLISFFVFITCIFLQFVLYYLQTGSFIVWSYGTESFNFHNPEIFNVLFSYRKGLFVYTPLVLISLIGLIKIFKQNKHQFTVLVFFLVLITYIISSWWCWWYGGSLGQRAFVDYYSIVGVLLAFSYNQIFEKFDAIKGILLSGLMTIFIIYSNVLYYQYRYFIIDSENMNKEKFWFSFLKTSTNYYGVVTINHFFDGKHPLNIISIKSTNGKYLSSIKDENNFIIANRNLPQNWEAFKLIELENNKVAFKTDDNKYFSARFDKTGIITHEANTILDWETFYLIKYDEKNCLIKSYDGKYITRNGDKFYADTYEKDLAEKFIIEWK